MSKQGSEQLLWMFDNKSGVRVTLYFDLESPERYPSDLVITDFIPDSIREEVKIPMTKDMLMELGEALIEWSGMLENGSWAKS